MNKLCSFSKVFIKFSLINNKINFRYASASEQFRQAVLILRLRQKSIHLREKSIAYPTERSQHRRQAAFISRFTLDVGRAPKCLHFVRARIRHFGLSPTQARREGYALFDEDDVFAGSRNTAAACLNCSDADAKQRPILLFIKLNFINTFEKEHNLFTFSAYYKHCQDEVHSTWKQTQRQTNNFFFFVIRRETELLPLLMRDGHPVGRPFFMRTNGDLNVILKE